MDIFIVAFVSITGFYFHWWIFKRIKFWVNRDLALSMAEGDKNKQAYMLEQLKIAEQQKVSKKDLADWLQQAANRYSEKS